MTEEYFKFLYYEKLGGYYLLLILCAGSIIGFLMYLFSVIVKKIRNRR